MQICSLYSGSSGNAVYLRLGGVSILVDAGKSARALCRALTAIGTDVSEIRAIFLTHEHNDHTSALENLLKKHRLPVHIVEASAKGLPLASDGALTENLVIHPILYEESLDGLIVKSFPTPHDSRASVGFRFSFTENGMRHEVGYATDVGFLSEAVVEGLTGCEAVVLECNHDIEMLKEGPYPYPLKQRILSRRGHLSNIDCTSLALKLAENGTKHILLAHLSETNNTPDIAFDEVFGALAGSGVNVAVADPREPVWLVREEPHELTENEEKENAAC
ncbi:MAG: MBL fold metallo-hydrolase [Ruminococcaceae bacterium]|nr:MBL fold metallo-hydrolase [Oscillospiraceae bacterium]